MILGSAICLITVIIIYSAISANPVFVSPFKSRIADQGKRIVPVPRIGRISISEIIAARSVA